MAGLICCRTAPINLPNKGRNEGSFLEALVHFPPFLNRSPGIGGSLSRCLVSGSTFIYLPFDTSRADGTMIF